MSGNSALKGPQSTSNPFLGAAEDHTVSLWSWQPCAASSLVIDQDRILPSVFHLDSKVLLFSDVKSGKNEHISVHKCLLFVNTQLKTEAFIALNILWIPTWAFLRTHFYPFKNSVKAEKPLVCMYVYSREPSDPAPTLNPNPG